MGLVLKFIVLMLFIMIFMSLFGIISFMFDMNLVLILYCCIFFFCCLSDGMSDMVFEMIILFGLIIFLYWDFIILEVFIFI